jgi:hypothetical protein
MTIGLVALREQDEQLKPKIDGRDRRRHLQIWTVMNAVLWHESDCAYNRAFAALRRVLRVLRSSWSDELILQLGRLMHGREMTDDGLRERVPYMYAPPVRMMNARLAAMAASAGLRQAAPYPMASTSLSQLKHRVTVFERVATNTRLIGV